MRARHLACPFLLALALLPASANAVEATATTGDAGSAAASPESTPRKLRVGTIPDPPFSMKEPNGAWTGLAVELWEEVAERLGVPFEWVEYDLDALEAALERGEIDVAAAAVPVTARNVRRFDFALPFLPKGYAIAAAPDREGSWLEELAGPLARRLRDVMLLLVAVLVGSAIVVWLLERRHNPDHFGGHSRRGVVEALWWSAATMTTVGYGDRTPVTVAGRLVAILVMFTSLILVSVLTGIVASRLTVVDLKARVTGLADLPRVKVGAVHDSAMQDFLETRAIRFRAFHDVEEAAASLAAGEIDALLAGEAELHWLIESRYPEQIVLVPGLVESGFVAFAVPLASPLRKPLDAALVEYLESPSWPLLRRQFLPR